MGFKTSFHVQAKHNHTSSLQERLHVVRGNNKKKHAGSCNKYEEWLLVRVLTIIILVVPRHSIPILKCSVDSRYKINSLAQSQVYSELQLVSDILPLL